MEQNTGKQSLEICVPYNNEILVEERKKTVKKVNVCLIILAVLMLAITVLVAFADAPAFLIAFTIFFAVVSTVCVICNLISVKPKEKNKTRLMCYKFSDYTLTVRELDKTKNVDKNIGTYLYRQQDNKQYVANVTELKDRFAIKILIGSTNFIPQYKLFCLPKSAIPDDDMLNRFTEFLKFKVKPDYVVKSNENN